MSYTYYTFDFQFVNRDGKAEKGFFKKKGVVEGGGISLDGMKIRYEDMYKVFRQHDKLLFVLYPAIAFAKELQKHILSGTNSLIIEIGMDAILDVKSLIDQRFSLEKANKHREELKAEGKEALFKTTPCPRCKSTVDLSMKKSTPYTFCEYCELVFSKLGQSIVNSEDFKICPECSYFNRVQYFPDAEFYYYGAEDNANFFGKKYYCDTCAQRDFKRQIVKNAPFLLAIPHTLRKKMQLESNIHPTLHEVTQANLLAQDGKLEEAEVLYLSLSLHNEFHPAVYYNSSVNHQLLSHFA